MRLGWSALGVASVALWLVLGPAGSLLPSSGDGVHPATTGPLSVAPGRASSEGDPGPAAPGSAPISIAFDQSVRAAARGLEAAGVPGVGARLPYVGPPARSDGGSCGDGSGRGSGRSGYRRSGG